MNLLGYCGMDDEGYFNALVRMFDQALKAIVALKPDQQASFVARIERVRSEGHIRPELRDERLTGRKVSVKFTGTLRKDQKAAVREMLKHEGRAKKRSLLVVGFLIFSEHPCEKKNQNQRTVIPMGAWVSLDMPKTANHNLL